MKKQYISPVCLSCVIEAESMICGSGDLAPSKASARGANQDVSFAGISLGSDDSEASGLND